MADPRTPLDWIRAVLAAYDDGALRDYDRAIADAHKAHAEIPPGTYGWSELHALLRNLDTDWPGAFHAARAFVARHDAANLRSALRGEPRHGEQNWRASAERIAAEVESWPAWKRADISRILADGAAEIAEAKTTQDPERIVAAALLVNGEIWSLPKPARHHVLIHAWAQAHWKDGKPTPVPDGHIQGFVTSSGRFLDREASLKVARDARQVAEHCIGGVLTSEDLW